MAPRAGRAAPGVDRRDGGTEDWAGSCPAPFRRARPLAAGAEGLGGDCLAPCLPGAERGAIGGRSGGIGARGAEGAAGGAAEATGAAAATGASSGASGENSGASGAGACTSTSDRTARARTAAATGSASARSGETSSCGFSSARSGSMFPAIKAGAAGRRAGPGARSVGGSDTTCVASGAALTAAARACATGRAGCAVARWMRIAIALDRRCSSSAMRAGSCSLHSRRRLSSRACAKNSIASSAMPRNAAKATMAPTLVKVSDRESASGTAVTVMSFESV